MTRKLFQKYDEETEQWLLQDIRDWPLEVALKARERDEDFRILFVDLIRHILSMTKIALELVILITDLVNY